MIAEAIRKWRRQRNRCSLLFRRRLARLDDLFSSAKDTEANQPSERERKLRRAKDEAKKSPDEKPRNPFDLD